MKKARTEYEDIRRMIEEATGCQMRTPKDFDLLALRIYDRTRTLISTSTLKRFWGYISRDDEGRGNLRRTSLNTLAEYIGYTNWEAFCNRSLTESGSDSSALFYGHRQLTTEDMAPGDKLVLAWSPNRLVTFRYSGNDVFMVIDSQNSKLSVGDTFKCHTFVEQQPLILVDLIHDDMPPCGYVCGKSGGIFFK